VCDRVVRSRCKALQQCTCTAHAQHVHMHAIWIGVGQVVVVVNYSVGHHIASLLLYRPWAEDAGVVDLGHVPS
jgi:hypothetical protein